MTGDQDADWQDFGDMTTAEPHPADVAYDLDATRAEWDAVAAAEAEPTFRMATPSPYLIVRLNCCFLGAGTFAVASAKPGHVAHFVTVFAGLPFHAVTCNCAWQSHGGRGCAHAWRAWGAVAEADKAGTPLELATS